MLTGCCVCIFNIIYLIGTKEIDDLLVKSVTYELISSKF